MSYAFYNQDCSKTKEWMQKTGTVEVITNEAGCDFLENCGLSKRVKEAYFCLYRLEQ